MLCACGANGGMGSTRRVGRAARATDSQSDRDNGRILYAPTQHPPGSSTSPKCWSRRAPQRFLITRSCRLVTIPVEHRPALSAVQYFGLTTSRLPQWAFHPLFWKPIVGAWPEAVDAHPIKSDKSRARKPLMDWTCG